MHKLFSSSFMYFVPPVGHVIIMWFNCETARVLNNGYFTNASQAPPVLSIQKFFDLIDSLWIVNFWHIIQINTEVYPPKGELSNSPF